MDSLLEKPICLSLNRNWCALGFLTPKAALVAMCGGVYGGTPPALALDLTIDELGNLIHATPTDWQGWIKLPVRSCDLALFTARGAIRCPTVIIRPAYGEMPLKAPKLSKRAILERDGFRCQYSGEVLPASKLNIDHVIPRDRGGRDEWSNLVACEKGINSNKGNRLNSEAGLVLTRIPKQPKPLPVSVSIGPPKRPEHVHFLLK